MAYRVSNYFFLRINGEQINIIIIIYKYHSDFTKFEITGQEL
jgi:hypothetical protein